MKRYAYVDLIRGIAALVVLVSHYRWFYATDIDVFPRSPATFLPLYDILWPIYEHGVAVQMFWLLSGFVFTVTYGHYGREISARNFWGARIARLYPLHLMTLLLVAALQTISYHVHGGWQIYGSNDAPHFIAHLFFASNWFTMENSFNAPIWTVSLEIIVYTLFFVVLKLFSGGLWISIILTVAGLALDRLTAHPLAMCAALFFIGTIIGQVTPLLQERLGRLTLVLGILGIVAVAGALAVFGVRAQILLIYAALPAALFTFVSMDNNLPALPKAFHWIGDITYSVYLLHMPVIIAARILVGPQIDAKILGSPMSLLAFIATVIGLSLICYRWFELPAQKALRRRLMSETRRQEQGPLPAVQAAP